MERRTCPFYSPETAHLPHLHFILRFEYHIDNFLDEFFRNGSKDLRCKYLPCRRAVWEAIDDIARPTTYTIDRTISYSPAQRRHARILYALSYRHGLRDLLSTRRNTYGRWLNKLSDGVYEFNNFKEFMTETLGQSRAAKLTMCSTCFADAPGEYLYFGSMCVLSWKERRAPLYIDTQTLMSNTVVLFANTAQANAYSSVAIKAFV